ncbi:hypothetical protein Afil01_08350 [Actinorhabdospora filicis]|uniref:Transcription regulator PadR N-terminal domain-containing protein n=1 Tax=Actinorhabdospora filicis TaxID=1785913 RepID=A0A9W6W7K1_9ACTN|nr:PadR family transcriptional regulator [Actinorhabdospora filicis]GLZ76028.1 hypothetical protein Afil01_08350 [Actinorhabdospora filicis]
MSLRIALLGLLQESECASGYDLTKHFELSAANMWSAKHSQIYPELRKMEADGAVTAEESGARGKRVYRLTPEGREELRRWLVETEPMRNVRSESGLRMFLLPLLRAEEAVPLLRAEELLYRARQARLRELCPNKPKPIDRYQIRMGEHMMAAMADWAAETADDIERRAAEGEDV